MFRSQLCPSSGASQLYMQSLVPCGAWFVVSSSPAVLQHSRTGAHNWVTTQQDWRTQLSYNTAGLEDTTELQHSRTGGHNEPSTTRDQRLHVQLRSSWWWTQWCPEHVERNNVNKIFRIFKNKVHLVSLFIQVIFIYVYMCVFKCIYICPYIHIYTNRHTCMYIYICVYI